MKPRISLITLAVADLERSLRFYRDGLGLQTPGIVGQDIPDGAVAFFDLEGGAKLALFPRQSMARDAGIPPVHTPGAVDFTLANNVASKEQVDAVMAEAHKAGATMVKEAQDTFYGGYAGYFRDPDGHLWEVAWNPQWKVAD